MSREVQWLSSMLNGVYMFMLKIVAEEFKFICKRPIHNVSKLYISFLSFDKFCMNITGLKITLSSPDLSAKLL